MTFLHLKSSRIAQPSERDRRISFLDMLFFVVIFAALLVRVINLDYNSAFNDEAIYIVVGRMGLYTSDWLSYGAKLWMAGLPYIYPVLSALAYETTGLLGSRFLNVIFGLLLVEEVYRLTLLLNLFDRQTNKTAAVIALFLSGFTATGIYVSKLATYDILSFLLMMVAITSFLRAQYSQNGKYYFISFVSIFFAFLTKIVVGIFFAPLFILSLAILRSRSKKHKQLALAYLYVPFFLGMSIYGLLSINNLMTFIATHRGQGIVEQYQPLFELIWDMSGFTMLMAIPASGLLALLNKTKQTASLCGLAAVIPVFHLTLRRFATLDKHIYLTEIFLSVIIGYATSYLIHRKDSVPFPSFISQLSAKAKLRLPLLSKLSVHNRNGGSLLFRSIVVFCLAFVFAFHSLQTADGLEQGWKNTKGVGYFLSEKVKPGDKVLTENGGALILMLYDKIFPPTNIVTFDWIDYSGITEEQAYVQAIRDGYFDFVEFDGESQTHETLTQILRQEMSGSYSLIYSVNNFEVYEKNES